MKTLSNIVIGAGLISLAYCAFMFLSAHLHQARETRRFVGEQPAEHDAASRPEPPAPADQPHPEKGSVVAMLSIPRLGMSTVVVEGAGERELKLGPGHIIGTPLPGDGGNVGVAGHRDTSFRPLRLIRNDDTITVTAHRREYRYKVVSAQVVEPDNIGVLYPTGRETLTLVT